MPPVGSVWNADWLNANSQRNYPLFEEATRKDVSDTFELPNNFIVDLIWPVQSDSTIDTSLFHVAAVSIFGTGVAISIGHDGVIIATVSIDASTFTRNSQFLLQGTGDFFDTIGKIVIGSLDTILDTAGSFAFDIIGGRLEPTVIRPDLRGVSSLRLQNGDDVSDPIQGDIIFEAGRNMSIQFIAGVGSEPDRVQMNAISGEGFNEECDCNEGAELDCIKTINGLSPKADGDFDLLGDDCLKLESIANGIKVTDDCAKPCCGCSELEVITATAESVRTQVFDLERLASQIEGAMQQMRINLLSSKTGTQQ